MALPPGELSAKLTEGVTGQRAKRQYRSNCGTSTMPSPGGEGAPEGRMRWKAEGLRGSVEESERERRRLAPSGRELSAKLTEGVWRQVRSCIAPMIVHTGTLCGQTEVRSDMGTVLCLNADREPSPCLLHCGPFCLRRPHFLSRQEMGERNGRGEDSDFFPPDPLFETAQGECPLANPPGSITFTLIPQKEYGISERQTRNIYRMALPTDSASFPSEMTKKAKGRDHCHSAWLMV